MRKDIQVQSVSNDTPLGGELESCSGWVFELKSKLRTIDPDVLQVDHEGQQYTRKLSELVPEYKQERESYLAAKSGPLR